jgi:hypothetical protein
MSDAAPATTAAPGEGEDEALVSDADLDTSVASEGAPSAGVTGGIEMKPLPGALDTDAGLSFSADSPYFITYVENDMKSLQTLHETLRDIAGRTRTFGKCGALMAEATRRLALSCRLRRPFVQKEGEDEKEMEEKAELREAEVSDRRHAVGEDMASLLSVMSEVSTKNRGLCDSRTIQHISF